MYLSPFLLLTSILLILAFPNPQISILAWIAFIPLFFIIDNSSKKASFLLSYLCGFLFFGGLLYWLAFVTKLGYLILISYSALYFGLFGLIANSLLNKLRASRLNFLSFLILPSLWVALEFIRGILFTGFPWGILGYTQYKNSIIIQIADITGPYGVSFLIIMINFAIYACLLNLFRKTHQSRRALLPQVIMSIIILAVVMFYGYSAFNEADIETGLKLSVVQGNIAQHKKWDPYYKDYILNRYETLTKEAAGDKSDLIIWPETAVPGFWDEEDINFWVKNIAKEAGIPLFLGVATYKSSQKKDYYFNSAVLISPDGNIKGKYDKLHLVPLGEYVPFEKQFPFARDFIDKSIGDYTPGDEFTVFDVGDYTPGVEYEAEYKYAALICFEDIFPELVRSFVRRGANFAINITNDAWFRESGEQLQHAQASVFRAVENRISVIRAGNTGFSCYINPKGIIEDSIYDEKTGKMYTAGFKTFELEISEKKTLYTKYGDIFAYLCILLTLVCVFYKGTCHLGTLR